MKRVISALLCAVGVLTLSTSFGQDNKIPTDKEAIKVLAASSWVNPYTYEASGEFKGFKFMKKGRCEAINIPSLDLKSWRIEKGWLIIGGDEIAADGKRSPYETKEKIIKLNKDSLRVLATETPRTTFLYINQKNFKKEKTAKK